jgi:hypothetical protein
LVIVPSFINSEGSEIQISEFISAF